MSCICYLLIVDNGKLICETKGDHFIIPFLKFDDDIVESNIAKATLSNLTHLKIDKNCFFKIYHNSSKKIFLYSCIVDCNSKNNKEIILSNFANYKCISFASVFRQKWDPWSEKALNVLEHSKKYENAVFLATKLDTFSFYSPSSKDYIKEHLELLENIWQFDKPDIILENNKNLIGIEEFVFDSSLYVNGSSTGLKASREAEAKLHAEDKGFNSITFHVENSLDYFYDNFLNAYRNHENRIECYIKNLKVLNTKNKDVHFGFLIKDLTMLGTYFRKDGKFVPLFPFYIKECWKELFKDERINFIIFVQFLENGPHAFFITRDDYNFLKEKKKLHNLNDIYFFTFNDPTIMSETIYIPFSDAEK